MAIQQRFFVEKGPTNKYMAQFIDPSVNAFERFKSPVITVNYDDTVANILETLDAQMDQLGYEPFDGNLRTDFFSRPGNPGAVAGRSLVYAMTVSGVVHLFARDSDGTIVQLTPTQNPPNYIKGLVTSFTSVSTVTIGAGTARDRLNKMDLTLAAPVVVNIAAAGVNGLDTGAEANSTWYFLYVIGDTTGVNPTVGIISAAQNSPTFPAGYDAARRVGSVRNGSTGDFRDFTVYGENASRSVQFRDALTTRQQLTGGAATVVTDVSLSQLVPPTSALARLQYQQRGVVDAWLYVDSTLAIGTMQRSLIAGATVCDVMQTMANRHIGYANAAAGGLLDIWVTGYEEAL